MPPMGGGEASLEVAGGVAGVDDGRGIVKAAASFTAKPGVVLPAGIGPVHGSPSLLGGLLPFAPTSHRVFGV